MLDEKEESSGLSPEVRATRQIFKEDFYSVLSMEEIILKQTSIIHWLKEKDRTTNFYHKITSSRHKTNEIYDLRINEVWEERENQIRSHVEKHFLNLFIEDWGARPRVDGI